MDFKGCVTILQRIRLLHGIIGQFTRLPNRHKRFIQPLGQHQAEEEAAAFNTRHHIDGVPVKRLGHPVYHRRTKLRRSEEHTSELQSLMRISYAVFCLKKKTTKK